MSLGRQRDVRVFSGLFVRYQQSLCGSHVGYSWVADGVPVGYPRAAYAVYAGTTHSVPIWVSKGCPWGPRGVRRDTPMQAAHRGSVGCPWRVLEALVGCAKGVRRASEGCPWGVYPTVGRVAFGGCPWGVRGISMEKPSGHLWRVLRVSMRPPWGVRWASMGWPRGVRRVAVNCPWVARRVSVACL